MVRRINANQSQSPPGPTPGTGTIAAGETYSLAEFQRRTGFSKSAIRALRRAKFPIRKVGKQCWVLGTDWVAFVASQPVRQEEPAQG